LEEDLANDLAVLQSYLESMLERVKQNSATLLRFQAFEMRLLKLNSLSDMIDHVLEDAKRYFDLDVVSLCLIDKNGEIAKALNEHGYDCSLKEGLMLLDTQELLNSAFDFTIRPYIGVYENKNMLTFSLRTQTSLPALPLRH
jgi:uncharacterized protein YigA (DUF484 family)